MWLTYKFSPQNPNIIHQRGDENTQSYQLLVVIQHQFLLTICKEMTGSWRGEITIKSCELDSQVLKQYSTLPKIICITPDTCQRPNHPCARCNQA